MIFHENPAPSGIRNRTAGSDIGKAPRSSHYATSLSKFIPILVLGLRSVTTTFTLTTIEVKPFLFVVVYFDVYIN